MAVAISPARAVVGVALLIAASSASGAAASGAVGAAAAASAPIQSAYAASFNRPGLWGPPTASINWCEPDYAWSFYVAEWWNTLSNALFVVLGLYGAWHTLRDSSGCGFELSYALQYLGVAVIGFGSAAFHAMLTHDSQQSDETPMVWSILIWFYLLHAPFLDARPALKRAMAWALAVYGVGFAAVHYRYRFTTGFQPHFMAWVLVCGVQFVRLYRQLKAMNGGSSGGSGAAATALLLGRMYVQSLAVGFSFWLLDFHLCDLLLSTRLNPHGHAWWHLFMGVNCFVGPVFVQFMRTLTRPSASDHHKRARPRIDFDFGFIPVVRHSNVC